MRTPSSPVKTTATKCFNIESECLLKETFTTLRKNVLQKTFKTIKNVHNSPQEHRKVTACFKKRSKPSKMFTTLRKLQKTLKNVHNSLQEHYIIEKLCSCQLARANMPDTVYTG